MTDENAAIEWKRLIKAHSGSAMELQFHLSYTLQLARRSRKTRNRSQGRQKRGKEDEEEKEKQEGEVTEVGGTGEEAGRGERSRKVLRLTCACTLGGKARHLCHLAGMKVRNLK